MSLYAVQKFLFDINRTESLQDSYRIDRRTVVEPYDLTDEEVEALVAPDIGLLFHFGVNGQILMHFAAFHQIAWADYLQQMRDGITTHGPVREGVYAMTTDPAAILIDDSTTNGPNTNDPNTNDPNTNDRETT